MCGAARVLVQCVQRLDIAVRPRVLIRSVQRVDIVVRPWVLSFGVFTAWS